MRKRGFLFVLDVGAGMKKILAGAVIALGFSGQAFAADIAARSYVKAPPLAQVYDWTGFYIGANAGVGFGRNRSEIWDSLDPSGTVVRSHFGAAGAIGGGQIGYNLQFNNIVLGVEADIQASGMRDNRTCQFCQDGFDFNQKLDWFGTVRGRIGYATGPVLSYVTGGFAYGGAKSSVLVIDGLAQTSSTATLSGTKTGWTLGSGVEAALGGNWTGKIEYLYVDLGTQSGTFADAGLPSTVFTSDIREHIFRVGLNYRIGGVAPYRTEPTADWTGFYAGVNGGSATALNPTTHTSTFSGGGTNQNKFNLSPDGYVGGVQAGYNWQAANWVYGLEADIQGSTQRDNMICWIGCLPLQSSRYDQQLQWFGTVRARLGYSVGSTLFYGTGGLAYGNVKTRVAQTIGATIATPEFDKTQAGWTIGAGIETPFAWLGRNWTVKTEYLYIDLGKTGGDFTYPIIGGTLSDTVSSHVQQHIFRAGLNYQINSPVIAKY